jgi:hypothetical protein
MANALTRMGQAISKRVAKVFTVPTTDKPKTLAQTGKYLAKQYFLQARDLPPFTFETIRVMLQDPSIKLNLAMRAAPIASVEFAYIEGEGPDGKPKYVSGIKAQNPVVAAYVKRQLQNIWNSYLPGILVSQNWGWAAGEVTLKLTHAGMIEIDELHPRHAKDCRLLETECTGERWGVQIQGLADVGKLDIPYPYCYFVNYRPENGEKYSASALIGAYSPWADKWLNGGALDTRRLYMHKDAYGGMKIAYPEEDLYVDGNPNAVPARDVAMQIAEQRQAGGTITYPSTVVDGVQKWRIEDATVSSNPAHILQYPKDLDDEMRHGLEIPDGAINNDGSGAWEGKTLPLAAMYAGLDTWVTQILTDLRKTIDPLVEMNFGPGQEYEICHKPLALQAMEQQGEKRQGGPQEDQQDPFAQMQGGQYRMSLDPVEAVGRGVLDAGELVKAARTAIRMSVAPVVDVETEGDDNNERATAIAELLTHLYGDDAESHFDEIFGKTIRMAAAWSAIDHPRGPNGRFIAKNSPEAVASAKDTIRNTLNGRRTADTLKTVTEHLSILSTKQLHELKREYNVKAGGAKPALIQKIASRIHGAAGSKAEPETEGPKLRENKTPTAPSPKDVHTVPTGSLKTDAKRFQYKVKDIGEDGVTGELKGVGKWNPELAGALLVWRDPENGQDYVVNGHHRHELANRLGADEMNVRYIDAPNAKEARARGALANIAEGRGSAIDAAKYLRDSGQDVEHLRAAGISLAGKVANDATILKNLADKPFQMVTQGTLDEGKAIAVAKHLKDHALQNALFKKLEAREEEGKDWSNREIETAAKKMNNAGKYVEQGQDLFGFFEDEKSTFDQEVELESHVGRLLAMEANDYQAVSNQRRADRVADAGNTLAVDENAKRAKTAADNAATFEREAGLRGPISAAIKEHAAELAAAKTKKEKEAIKAKTLESVRAALAPAAEPQPDTVAPAPEPVAEATPPKQPHELTEAEYLKEYGDSRLSRANHAAQVEQAIEDGETIPRSVAKEFDTHTAKHQPHMLTAKEYRQATGRDTILSPQGPRAIAEANAEHAAAVKAATAAGKNVVPEVLADYPAQPAAPVIQEATASDKPSEAIPQPPAGIQMPSQTVSNADAKEGDQLGLFGEATKAKVKAPEMKIGEPTTGKQGGLFDTHGNADQMDLFGDAGMDSSMVYKPEAGETESERVRKEQAAKLREENRSILATPLMSEGNISPMQVGEMSDNQREKYSKNVQEKMRIESQIKALERTDAEVANFDKQAKTKENTGKLSQAVNSIDRILSMERMAFKPNGELKIGYQRAIEDDFTKLRKIATETPELIPQRMYDRFGPDLATPTRASQAPPPEATADKLKAAGIDDDSSQEDISRAIANRKITKEDATKARERLIEKETKRQEEAAEYSNRTNTNTADGIAKVSNDEFANGNWDRSHAGLASEAVQSKIAKGMEGIENREYAIREHIPGKFQLISRPAGKPQESKPKSKPENKPERVYEYGMVHRPPSIGTHPKDATAIGKHEAFKHGTVSYNRPLTEKEIRDFELRPIRTEDDLPAVAQAIANEMGDYLPDYQEDDEVLTDYLNNADARKIIGHADIEAIKKHLKAIKPK